MSGNSTNLQDNSEDDDGVQEISDDDGDDVCRIILKKEMKWMLIQKWMLVQEGHGKQVQTIDQHCY